jgi:hypothetical protein
MDSTFGNKGGRFQYRLALNARPTPLQRSVSRLPTNGVIAQGFSSRRPDPRALSSCTMSTTGVPASARSNAWAPYINLAVRVLRQQEAS